MKKLTRIRIVPTLSLEKAWDLLERAGIEILYGSEEEDSTELFVSLESTDSLDSFDWIEECSPYQLPSIDWEAQWAAHGLNFQNGFVHVDFEALGRTASVLRLQPGSGFGDLSHPTTRLMLDMLVRFLQKEQTVIDIGCGSGILTLAAAALGSQTAIGIDIDPEAIEHSRQNSILNQLEKSCTFFHPSEFKLKISGQPTLILMNMIHTEQLTAWSSLPDLHHQTGYCLTSGIRKADRDSYLAQTAKWGWVLQEEKEEDDWVAFYFSANSPPPTKK